VRRSDKGRGGHGREQVEDPDDQAGEQHRPPNGPPRLPRLLRQRRRCLEADERQHDVDRPADQARRAREPLDGGVLKREDIERETARGRVRE
jgi:hypothetical protein